MDRGKKLSPPGSRPSRSPSPSSWSKVGFDDAVEKDGVKRVLENSQLNASDLVGKLIYYTLLPFVLQLAFGVFGSNPISDPIEQVITFLPSLIVALVILVIAAAVKTLVEGTLGGLSYGSVLAASIFILFLGVVAAPNQVGVATTVTTPVLIFILATLGGVVVGVGGGLVKPMQHRWEDYQAEAEAEAPRIRERAANAPSAREQAERAKARLEQQHDGDQGESAGDYERRTGYADDTSTRRDLYGRPERGYDDRI